MLAFISTRSKFFSSARDSAWSIGKTPNCLPSLSITLTSFALIALFTLKESPLIEDHPH